MTVIRLGYSGTASNGKPDLKLVSLRTLEARIDRVIELNFMGILNEKSVMVGTVRLKEQDGDGFLDIEYSNDNGSQKRSILISELNKKMI